MPDRSSERAANMREVRLLRAVFLAGAVTDAVALLPMLLPSFAALLWGLREQAILLCLFGWASYAGRQASRAPEVLP